MPLGMVVKGEARFAYIRHPNPGVSDKRWQRLQCTHLTLDDCFTAPELKREDATGIVLEQGGGGV
jgi:hypothetical protein